MKTNKTEHSRWQQFISGLAMIAVASLTALTLSGCSSSSSSDAAPPAATVVAPAAPTAFTATAGENVVTLQWSPAASSVTAGLPDSYEIYRSTTATTAATIVSPTNFVTTTPVVDGQTVYTFTNTALAGNTTYYFVVTAKNAGGETPSTVASAKPTGPPNPVVAGNNFSAALIFADNIGITNLALDPLKSWAAGASAVTAIDYNTGLRPLAAEVTAMLALTVPQTTLPYLTVPSKIDPSYYEQKSINTWQGEWAAASGVQNVTAKWGDNMTSASLKASSKIRIEMVLTKDVTATPMTAYTMKLLSGSGTNELQGTNGVIYNPTTAFVFATNAHLMIQKFNGTSWDAPLVDQALFDTSVPDGLNKLSGEIPVSGNFTYGFVWQPSTSGSTAGIYRVTFKLDDPSQFGVGHPANNTFIQTATNGVLVSPTEAYIDINVK
jgi:hypothetical protein